MFLEIDKFYTREHIKVMFFGYVNALRFNMPTSTLEKCALNFMKHHGLNEETFNAKSAIVEYQRMADEYLQTQKSDGKAKE